MLTPLVALVLWTMVVWAWLYVTRIPAMQSAQIHPQKAIHPGSLDVLPMGARVVADNYNHLHEQPTLFYAVCLAAHAAGADGAFNVALAWAYVGARVAHSLVQIVVRRVALRFYVFAASSVVLAVLAVRLLLALV